MRVIVDAQLPYSLCRFFIENGVDAIHTIDLPQKNKTSDLEINKLALSESRIVITKDDDFLQTFLLNKIPPKLILVKTGNISNVQLISIFYSHLQTIIELLEKNDLIEINKNEIIVHE